MSRESQHAHAVDPLHSPGKRGHNGSEPILDLSEREPGFADHARIAASVDRVLEVWSSVGLATLMAEIHGVTPERIIEILDELAAAGVAARTSLLGERPDSA